MQWSMLHAGALQKPAGPRCLHAVSARYGTTHSTFVAQPTLPCSTLSRSWDTTNFMISMRLSYNRVSARGVQIDLVACRFTIPTSKTSGFSLWIYAVPTTSNTTRLIISAGLDPSKAFGQEPGAKLDLATVKRNAARTFFSLRPR